MIKTASWFTKLPSNHIRVGVSRGVPRGHSGFKRYRPLEPGPWFNSVPIPEYLRRYRMILDALNPQEVCADLMSLGGGQTPVLACFESVPAIASGQVWCHRHLAAQWLEDRLGIYIEEIGHPNLDRFATFKAHGIAAPSYKRAQP